MKNLFFTADQVVALSRNNDAEPELTMLELYPNLPSLPNFVDRPRYLPPPDTIDHLRSRLKANGII